MRNQGLPRHLNEHLRVVKRTGRRVGDVPLDPAVFAGDIGLLAEFEEVVLARETLPALDSNPRRINASGGELGRAGGRKGCGRSSGANARRIAGAWTALNRFAGAIGGARSAAIDRARYAQGGGHGDN